MGPKANIVDYTYFFTKSGDVQIDKTTQSGDYCNWKRTEEVCKLNGVEKSQNQQRKQKICEK